MEGGRGREGGGERGGGRGRRREATVPVGTNIGAGQLLSVFFRFCHLGHHVHLPLHTVGVGVNPHALAANARPACLGQLLLLDRPLPETPGRRRVSWLRSAIRGRHRIIARTRTVAAEQRHEELVQLHLLTAATCWLRCVRLRCNHWHLPDRQNSWLGGGAVSTRGELIGRL